MTSQSLASSFAAPSLHSPAIVEEVERSVAAQVEDSPRVRLGLLKLIMALIQLARVGRLLLHEFEKKRQEVSGTGAIIAAAEAAGLLPTYHIRLVRAIADLADNAQKTWEATKNKALLATSLVIVFGIIYGLYCLDPNYSQTVYLDLEELGARIKHLPILNVFLACYAAAIRKGERSWNKALTAMIRSLPQSMDATGIAIPAGRIIRKGIELYKEGRLGLQALGELQDSILSLSPASLSTDPDFLLVTHLVNLVCSIYRGAKEVILAEEAKLARSFGLSLQSFSAPFPSKPSQA